MSESHRQNEYREVNCDPGVDPIIPLPERGKNKTPIGDGINEFTKQNPAVFSYSPLNSDRREIRVLDVEQGSLEGPVRACIRHISLLDEHIQKYEAVSYAWGDPSLRAEVYLNGQVVDVPRSAEEALRYLRSRDENKTIWIDALCINQTDVNERNHQVALMGDVYRNTTCTLVWLGESDEYTKYAFRYFDVLWENVKDQVQAFEHEFGKSWATRRSLNTLILKPQATRIILSLYSRPWFSRLWVAQEVALAPESICYCGTFVWRTKELLTLAAWMSESFSIPTNFFSTGTHNGNSLFAAVKVCHDPVPCPFIYLVETSQRLETSDPRDHIYGLLGLIDRERWSQIGSDSSDLLRPDYSKSAAQIFTNATMFAIKETRSLKPFALISHRLANDPEWTSSGMPSWVPQWNRAYTPEKDSRRFNGHHWNVGGFFRANFDVTSRFDISGTLRLRGVVIGRVQSLAAVLRSRKHDDSLHTVQNCAKLVQCQFPPVNDEDEAYFSALLRTLAGGKSLRDTCICQECCTDGDRQFNADVIKVFQSMDRTKLTEDMGRWLRLYSRNRRFFVTQQNHFGLGPQGTAADDVVCVLVGGQLPVVLRPSCSNYYLMGECYIDGIMHEKKPWKAKELDMQKFCLM